LQPGGLNFDAKVRRESTEVEDLFIAHINAMDSLARGLRNAARIIEEGVLKKIVEVTRKILLNENVYLIYRFIEGALWIFQIKHWLANK
jgi:xylose isomerase